MKVVRVVNSVCLGIFGFLGTVSLARADEHLVELVREGSVVGRYGTFADGMGAALDGDTLGFLRDLEPSEAESIPVTKAVTLDLRNHAATNSLNSSSFVIRASPVILLNGTIGGTGSAVLKVEGSRTVFATNVVFKGSCAFASDDGGASLYAGKNCVFLSALGGNCGRVFVEDATVGSYGALVSSAATSPLGRIFVRGGIFAADPSLCVVGLNRTESRETTTAWGACNFAVVARKSDELGCAGIVLGEGLTNIWDTVDAAVSKVSQGGTVALLSDTEATYQYGHVLWLRKELVLDLGGHTLSNSQGCSVLQPAVANIVIRNGVLEGSWNPLVNLQSDATVFVTNVVFRNNGSLSVDNRSAVFGATSGSAKAVLNGCTVESGLRLLSSATSGSLDVVSCDVFSTSLASAGQVGLNIRSGRFAANPTEWLLKDVWSCQISETTPSGTLAYHAFPITGESPLVLDLSGTDVPVFCGTVPDAGATVYVAFRDSGAWNRHRRLMADFSQMANAAGLSVSVTSYPEALDYFRAFMSGGKLYATTSLGALLIVR